MLHTTYQGSRPIRFRQEHFLCLHKVIIKHGDPLGAFLITEVMEYVDVVDLGAYLADKVVVIAAKHYHIFKELSRGLSDQKIMKVNGKQITTG